MGRNLSHTQNMMVATMKVLLTEDQYFGTSKKATKKIYAITCTMDAWVY